MNLKRSKESQKEIEFSNKIDELCTVVLPTFFPGNEIFENIKSIPSELNILIIVEGIVPPELTGD